MVRFPGEKISSSLKNDPKTVIIDSHRFSSRSANMVDTYGRCSLTLTNKQTRYRCVTYVLPRQKCDTDREAEYFASLAATIAANAPTARICRDSDTRFLFQRRQEPCGTSTPRLAASSACVRPSTSSGTQ